VSSPGAPDIVTRTGRDAKIDWKALSKRIGHADVAFTMKQYVQTDLEADRQVGNGSPGEKGHAELPLNVLRTGAACPMAATLAVLRHHT